MTTATLPAYDVKDLKLAPQGKKRILWADHDMPSPCQQPAPVPE